MVVGRTTKKLVLDEVVIALLSKEMRQKDFESTKATLVVRGRLKKKGKKRDNGKSKSHGRSKSLGKYKERYWISGKVGHFKRDCNEEKKGRI